jgi:hypothetical protein
MREQPVVADVDSKYSEDEKTADEKNDACPAEEPGNERQCSDQVDDKETVNIVFLPSHRSRLSTRRLPGTRETPTIPSARWAALARKTLDVQGSQQP